MEMADFEEKETVLCYHGPMLYEAKILEIEDTSDGPKYTVHYKGWKDKYDEKVPQSSIMKLNEDGLALQEELKAKHNGRSPGSEDETEHLPDPASAPFKVGKFFIPTEITDIIGKDWAIVNEHKHLLVLPASVTINDMLEEFGKVYRKKKIVGLGVFDQFVGGLKRALDTNIGRGLLYRFERIQLQKTMEKHPGVPLSEIYPPVVLLRYLLKLPHHLDDTGLGKSAQIFTTTKKLVEALMKFIVDFRKDFFPNNLYVAADEQYLAQFEELS